MGEVILIRIALVLVTEIGEGHGIKTIGKMIIYVLMTPPCGPEAFAPCPGTGSACVLLFR